MPRDLERTRVLPPDLTAVWNTLHLNVLKDAYFFANSYLYSDGKSPLHKLAHALQAQTSYGTEYIHEKNTIIFKRRFSSLPKGHNILVTEETGENIRFIEISHTTQRFPATSFLRRIQEWIQREPLVTEKYTLSLKKIGDGSWGKSSPEEKTQYGTLSPSSIHLYVAKEDF